MSAPIPDRLMHELDGYLSFVYDNGDLPDGAWFYMLENDCEQFMKEHGIKGDENDAVHQFIEWKASNPAIAKAEGGAS